MVTTARLSLTTAVPVLKADTTGIGTIFFVPYVGFGSSNAVTMIADAGLATFTATTHAELSQALNDSTKSPAAGAANKNYDMFVWVDGATVRCTRGPAWTSDTARGTGAGTTELIYQHGILVNNVAITNGPGAGRGTYVGSIRTNGSTQSAMNMNPAPATGGAGNRLDVWNMYNRVDVGAVCRDDTNTWTFTASDTWQQKNANAGNQITIIVGQQEDAILAVNAGLMNSLANSSYGAIGIGLDATNALAAACVNQQFTPDATTISAGRTNCATAFLNTTIPIGFHTITAIENTNGTNFVFVGDNGVPARINSGLTLRFKM